jgi:hypothetical protein
MGLLTKLTQEGSAYTPFDGSTPSINPLATDQSKLHADGNQPGYSITGNNANIVSSQYNEYNDDMVNSLPNPSLLDTNGITPAKYEDNLPG